MRIGWPLGRNKRHEAVDSRTLAQRADSSGSYVEAYSFWLKLAESGEAEACFLVGDRLERGQGVLQSFSEAESWFLKAAQLGWSPAYSKLGEIYFTGRQQAQTSIDSLNSTPANVSDTGAFAMLTRRARGISIDYAAAAKWNELAAEADDPKAQVRLGFQYAAGLGVPIDYMEAEHHFRAAAANNEAGGQLGLGMLFAGGHGRTRDTIQAQAWLEQAAEQGNITAKVCLAVLLIQADEELKDETVALRLLNEAAETRHPEAMFLLGQCLRSGVGCSRDEAAAESWFRRASAVGHIGAMLAAGSLASSRDPPDYNSAAAFFRDAADRGNGDAQFALGELYVNGLGVPQDAELAAKWFEKASQLGVSSALQRVGAMYADGLGLEQSFEKAADWFARAAEGGHSTANFQLGVLYHYGLGVPKDAEKALSFYRLAATQRDSQANLRLGVLHSEGELVPQSWKLAADYYEVAAKLGNKEAKLNLGFVLLRGLVGSQPELGLRLMIECAQAGDHNATWSLYRLYSEGTYQPRDVGLADQWLLQAAELGYPAAALELARRLHDDSPVPAPSERLVELLEDAARSGDASSQSMLGLFLYQGRHTAKDPDKALMWFARSANRGDAFAQAWLGDVLASGQGVPQDIKASRAWYLRAAKQGHIGSLLALTASAPPSGEIPYEDRQLFDLWFKAAETGNVLAQRMVGDFLARGIRCRQSLPDAASWLRKASLGNNAAAQMILGALLLKGVVAQDYPGEAIDLLTKAAGQDNQDAIYNLGLCYSHGISSPIDKDVASYWLRKGSQLGHAPSQVALGDLLVERAKSNEDYREARELYSAAETTNLSGAHLGLAHLYENGLGVTLNRGVARGFYEKAAEAGSANASAGIRRCTG